MGGWRVLRWLGLLIGGESVDAFQISNEEGGCDMYRDDMVPPLTSPSIDDAPRKGLWNETGAWSTPDNEVEKDVFAAPWEELPCGAGS